jgi:hypothetical protein
MDSRKKKGNSRIDWEVSIPLICSTFNVNIMDVDKFLENLPITDFYNYLEQSFNIPKLYQEARFNKSNRHINPFETRTAKKRNEIVQNTLEMLREKRRLRNG